MVVIPQGTRLHGSVDNVVKLGLGLKHRTASISYRFSTIEFSDGEKLPISAQLNGLETAKESVDSEGVVRGVHTLANVSSASNFYTLPLLCFDPLVGIPVWGVKTLIAPSTSPEIYFPEGAEFTMRLSRPLNIPHVPLEYVSVRSLSTRDVATTREQLQVPSRIRAQAGKNPSDFINLLFIGTKQQIKDSFQAAGWSEAERKSPVALYKAFRALTRRIGYGKAPMNSLRLDGKYSDFVFQKSLNTIAKRHHVRFWRESPGSDVWLGAATEDVALSFRRMHWSHIIDPAIDHERAKVVNDLAFTGCIESANLLKRNAAAATGHTVKTDGGIAAVRFNSCEQPQTMPGARAQMTPLNPRWFPHVLKSFADDLARSNPFFTAYNTFRCMNKTREEPPEVQQANTNEVRPGLDWMKSPETHNVASAGLLSHSK